MMKQYYLEYWTQHGQKIGITISALSAFDAKRYAEKLPDFRTMLSYPKEVSI